MLDRLNILELFGADKNKYHSCIITCYSFDFLFFEQRVLPMLRRAGMININVFVDAKMYQQQLANLDGNYITKQSYSITPIQLKGAFHPKILMGIGKNNGFLAVGSGNLTNSGLSSNDEVWGAFHTYKTESKALPLFKTVYNYLQNLKPFCYGANLQKWDWLLNNSKWLTEMAETSNNKFAINNKEKLIVLNNFKNTSIYKELLDNLPTKRLKNITIISPYYNKKGDVITNLLNDLNPETIDVVVDSRFGTVPFQLSVPNTVQFHNWESIKNNGVNESPRLHAKIIQFKYKDETYILTGSTNATIEALGSKTTAARNAEMSLLLQVNENKNWLEELDIKIPLQGTFDIKNYKKVVLPNNNTEHQTYSCYINYAELDLLHFTLYLSDSNKIPEGSFVVVEKIDGKISSYPFPSLCLTPIVLELNEIDANLGFKVYIVDTVNQRISNYEKIHNTQLIQRTNPDTKSSKFLEIINGTELENSDLAILLEFANFKDDNVVRNASSNNVRALGKTNEQDTKEYDKVAEVEFNKNEGIIQQRFHNATSHLTLLEDFLNNMTFGDVGEDLSDSLERGAEDAKDGGIGGDNSVVNEYMKLTFHEGQRIKGKLHKTLENINASLVLKHQDVLENLIKKLPSNKKVTIENLQALLVGTHLIFIKLNESYDEERFKIVIEYKTIEDLASFEKIKGIKLKRIEGFNNLKSSEVAYSADANVISDIENIISDYEGIKLVLNDETPSISIPHSFFQDSPILVKNGIDLSSKKGFLIHTVSKLFIIMANGTEEYNSQELLKFKAFKKRLFYRLQLLFLTIKWKDKEFYLAKLFLLNVFYFLIPENAKVENITEELDAFKSKLNLSKIESTKSEEFLLQTLKSFMKWKETYNNNKTALILEMDRSTIGGIIFKEKFGFAIVNSNFKRSLNLKSPLGFFNEDNKEFEIKNVLVGLKAIMYKENLKN